MMLKGIDVSRYQLKDTQLNQSTLAFMYIKASQSVYKDPAFMMHNAEADQSYLLKGFYHYYDDKVNPVAQAQYFWNAVQPVTDEYTLPPWFDLEDPNAVKQGLQQRCTDFLGELSRLSGLWPIVYTNKYYFEGMGMDLSAYKLADACYRINPAVPYGGWSNWTFWQYTNKSAVIGEISPLDGDLFNGGAKELLSLTHAATFKDGLSPDDWVKAHNVKVY